ncbi:hypothetical protein N8835_02530 [Alphaproteobacteria bacterium]|nr:hypothetical protein [Alphaproteobacteria bacterium]
MFLLVLMTCVTLEGQTVCHEFPRDHQFTSLSSCRTAGAIERGQYRARITTRDWASYDWDCVTEESIRTASATASNADQISPTSILVQNN